jgi:hypothetical protein
VSLKPWDVIKDVTNDKKRLVYSDNEAEYNKYLTNKALSYFADTVHYANAMNVMHGLDGLMQHDFLFHGVTRRRRYAKWNKRDTEVVAAVGEYLGLGPAKAREAIRVLADDVISSITSSASSNETERDDDETNSSRRGKTSSRRGQ